LSHGATSLERFARLGIRAVDCFLR